MSIIIRGNTQMRFFTLLILLGIMPFDVTKGKEAPDHKCKFDHFHSLNKIAEPSDIVFDDDHCYIVSDHGVLFECDADGKPIRRAEEEGYDFEGVEVTDSFIYVSDEIPRIVYQYRKSDLALVRKYDVKWNGGANKAYESIAYNQAKHCFILVSEQPAYIVEYDTNFKEIQRYPFRHARDISAARWYNGALFLLSDMDQCVFLCDPVTYEVKDKYKINILNPEGLAFDKDGKMIIVSDALERIYFFNDQLIKPQK